MDTKEMITRIAPSPSGYFHIGNLRTLYFNWLASRSVGGKFILRIDNTNTDKSNDIYVKDIINNLEWLNIDYDDIIYSSDRTDVYKKYLNKIDPKYLMNDDGCIRLNIDGNIIRDQWKDSLIKKPIKTSDFNRGDISKMVLMKNDGMPTYHFQSVIDDIDMGVNCIIRGSDHIGNTLKHITLYDIFEENIPNFYHVGLLHNMNGKKFSKRNGSTSVTDYKNMGFSSEALLNFLLRLGWSPRIDDKSNNIIDRDKALSMFWDGGKMGNSSAKVDMNKLNWYNKKYKN